jgi:hypothetical protein
MSEKSTNIRRDNMCRAGFSLKYLLICFSGFGLKVGEGDITNFRNSRKTGVNKLFFAAIEMLDLLI